MVIKEIQNDIFDIYGALLATYELQDEVCAYVYVTYPGNYILTVKNEQYGDYLDFEFENEAEEVFFRLKYL